jgi:hypothetical protein
LLEIVQIMMIVSVMRMVSAGGVKTALIIINNMAGLQKKNRKQKTKIISITIKTKTKN